jgi:hypothetical protein
MMVAMLERPRFSTPQVVFVLIFALAALGGDSARGLEFRVENRVFSGNDKEPQIQSITIFCGKVVYDFLEEPAEITVFDEAHGRFVLLDPVRRVKTELTTGQLESLTLRLKEWARRQPDDFLQFLAAPKFEEAFDRDAAELTFDSPWMSYRLRTVPAEDAEMARQYREFCDWYCRLNTRLNPGSRPPFARMIVNEALERYGRFPQQVDLTIRPRKDGLLAKKITVRSEHQLVRQLLESDRGRVAQTDQFMAIFKPLSFDEYQRKIQDE